MKEDTYSGTPFENRVFSAIANGTPLEKHDEKVIKETVESIWGKPPYTELLDKIRAEIISDIENEVYDALHGDKYASTYLCGMRHALEIIDKYREENNNE